ncbi:MAG: epimerase, partial [Gammaproteobacteria bacterium]
MVSNWLITGGCGFIGSSLIKKLIEKSPEVNVRVLDNLAVGSREDLRAVCEFNEIGVGAINGSPVGIELLVADIGDDKAALAAASGADVVVHLAANTGVGPSVDDPRTDCATNVFGTFNMLEAARHKNVGKFVFASSGAPIGDLEAPPIHEELPAHPVSPYG